MTAIPDSVTMPRRVAALARDRHGRPVPFFVAWIDGEPDFRVADPQAYRAAVRDGACWICGESQGGYRTFVIGPMCVVNRTSSEPPGHTDCAEFSAKACPFLARPDMRRRPAGLPEGSEPAGGEMIERNPGVTAVWATRRSRVELFSDGKGGALFNIGEPVSVSWWREGRPATVEEVRDSVDSGMPALREMCESDDDHAALTAAYEDAARFFVIGVAS